MTDILVEMFEKRFPPIGPHKTSRVSTYYGIERVHLNLLEKIFLDIEESLVKISEIENLACKVFNDIYFEFYEDYGDWDGAGIRFKPQGIDKYTLNYMGHNIVIHRPYRIPRIMISTGNRGAAALHPRQREKYFQFVDKLYNLFMERAKAKQ